MSTEERLKRIHIIVFLTWMQSLWTIALVAMLHG